MILGKNNLQEGSVKKHLLKLTLPMMVGITSIFLSNLIDAYYVGKLGTNQLASLGFVFPVSFALMSITIGLGVGTSSIISRKIGQKDFDKVKELTLNSLLLSCVVATFLSITGLLSIDEVFGLMGAKAEVMPYIRDYMQIWYLGVGLVIVPMVGNSAIRATGDTVIPGFIIGVSALVNILIDPFLVFGIGPFPRLEVAGAALATVISWISSFALAMWFLIVHKKLVARKPNSFYSLWSSWGQLLYISVPVAMSNLLNPFAITVVTAIVANHGTEAVAAYGIGTRIEPIAMVFVLAMTAALPPIVGQNWGAMKKERVKEVLWKAIHYGIYVEIAVFILLAIFAAPIAQTFSQDMTVVNHAKWFMWIVPLGYVGHSVVFMMSTTLNAVNKPLTAAGMDCVRVFALMLPLTFIGSQIWGLNGIFAGLTVAEILAAVFALNLAYKFSKSIASHPKSS